MERMEEIALISKVTEGLSPQLQGLTDKTLSEFIMHLTEQQIKKDFGGGANAAVQQAQGLRQRLQDNGAPDIPLSLCKKLLEWTESHSLMEFDPRIESTWSG